MAARQTVARHSCHKSLTAHGGPVAASQHRASAFQGSRGHTERCVALPGCQPFTLTAAAHTTTPAAAAAKTPLLVHHNWSQIYLAKRCGS